MKTGLIGFCSFLLLLGTFGIKVTHGQVANTVVSIEDSGFTTQPMAVTGLYMNHETILPLVPFNGYEGWVGDFRIRMKNTYSHAIRQIIVHLNFPAKNPDGEFYLPSQAITRGKNYAVHRTPTDSSDTLFLRPGEEITLRLSDQAHERLLTRMSRGLPLDVLRNVQIELKLVVFEDLDKGWGGGFYLRRATDSEQSWRIEEGKVSAAFAPVPTKLVARRVVISGLEQRVHRPLL